MAEIILSYFQVGVVVRVKTSFLNEPAGVLAYVYECYDKPGMTGVSLITENGVDLGGFSLREQAEYLEQVYDTGIIYVFKNVIQLDRDFEQYIKPLFK
jgi:hypothetical protein